MKEIQRVQVKLVKELQADQELYTKQGKNNICNKQGKLHRALPISS